MSNSSELIKNKSFPADIKIFVSHRIDVDSYIINNPLYVNVRCGAFYDNKKSNLIGDDTGINISEKRETLNEFTVQYWAWKNVKADYYGLCHYRRYLSFSDQQYPLGENGHVIIPTLDDVSANQYGLLDIEKMKEQICKYDFIVNLPFVAGQIAAHLPHGDSVRELWMGNAGFLIEDDIIDRTLRLIQKNSPDFLDSAKEYLRGNLHRGYNCYIMRKELFERLCQFQFPIILELEENVRTKVFPIEKMKREAAFMGELLYGIFIHHITTKEQWAYKEVQLLRFLNTEKKNPMPPNNLKDVLNKIKKRHNKKQEQVNQLSAAIARIEQQNARQSIILGINSSSFNLTKNLSFEACCFANELHEIHKKSFSEFKNCHRDRCVAVVASGPSLTSYSQMPNVPHIGVNSSFKSDNVQLDYYFTTDFEHHCDWFYELKNYDFIKFFGQYSIGRYRNTFQIPETLIEENNARLFYQAAPDEEIHLNIEYHPLMGFYSIAFQAIHFAIYTHPKKLFLIGCDCSVGGYFDGSIQYNVEAQARSQIPKWVIGYQKLKAFVERFYPDIEIISVNPVGLKGLFHDVYTEDYLDKNPEIDRYNCEILSSELYM